MTFKKFLMTAAATLTLLIVLVGPVAQYSDGIHRKQDAHVSERAAFVKQAREQDAIMAAARAATVHHDPGSTILCPPPHYRMTERDGCQPARR